MFKIFKKLFSKGGDNPVAAAPRVPRVVAAAPVATGFRNPEAAPGVEVASLSLRAILERLPADLRAAVNQMPEGDVKVILPVNAIMKQLPTGSVKMSLGSLYRQAPNGTFRKTNFEDKRMIDVPLGEVFKNINPGRLHRRNDQRQYEVPDDVQGLFGNGTDRNVPAPGPAAPGAVVTEPVKPLRMPGLAPLPVAQPSGQNGVKTPTNGHGGHGHAPSAMSMPEQQPAEALKLTGELSLLLVEIGAAWPEGIRSELSVLTGDTKVILPVAEVSAGLQKGKVAFTWGQVRNWLSPAPTTPIHLPEETVLTLPLKIVAPAFVAATGAKKRQSGGNVNQSLPDFFGPSAGRMPTSTPPAPAPPAPAALAPQPPLTMPAPTPVPVEREPAVKPTVEAVPVPSLPPAAEPPMAPPVAFVPPVAETPSAYAPIGAGPADLATLFNLPGKTDWSPNELVKLTCGLPGVIGAVVALEEGLVVAQKLPDGLSSDTFAAFMPQIFSRLDKYTGEMQLGDTTEITITTAGGPCQFFRRGKLFFATLGRTGEYLPAGLHLVAMELANQNN